MVRTFERSGAWAVAAGALVPLLPGALIAPLSLGEGTGAALLLAAVAAGCTLGGFTAGVAASVLATSAFAVFVLPADDPAAHLLGFAVAAAAVLVVYWRVRNRSRGTERARVAAESRADALAERVKMLGPMLDSAPIGFALMDAGLRFRYANGHYAEFTGIPVADHLGRTPADLFGPEIGRTTAEVVATVLKTGETQEAIVVPVSWPHGVRHYLSNRYPVRDPDGQVVGVGFGAIDITDKVTLELEHQRALAELTATVRSAPVAIALLGTDLTFHQVNRPFQELSGAVVGMALSEAGELPPVVRALAVEVGASGESRAVSDVEIRGDGVSFANVTCFPVRIDDGTVVAVALMIMDVSEQHRLARLEAEARALRATAELAGKLEQAQRLARMGSWEVDLATGAVTGSTQMEAIVGDPAGFLYGHGDTVVHPVDADRMGREFRRLRAGGEPFAGEFRLVLPDGTELDVYGTGDVIRDPAGDPAGRPVRLWGTLQDVTAQRAQERMAEAAIRAADQARAQLEAEHRALQMFVQAMLPSSLPTAPETEIVAAYLPVVERVDIGGDWFDSFQLPDGRFALAVGDVTGHDLQAATIMGQVRNAVRAYAFEDPSPGEVLRRVNQLLNRVADLDLVTMVYGVYDPAIHELTWANAGHPAPLFRHRGEVVELDDPSGLILGAFAENVEYLESTVRLTPGDTVLLYTDGLVDHRAADPQEAMSTLVDVVATGPGTPKRLLAEVTDRMLAGDVQDDDVCLLALHRTATDAVPVQPVATHDRVPLSPKVAPPGDPLPGPVAWAAWAA